MIINCQLILYLFAQFFVIYLQFHFDFIHEQASSWLLSRMTIQDDLLLLGYIGLSFATFSSKTWRNLLDCFPGYAHDGFLLGSCFHLKSHGSLRRSSIRFYASVAAGEVPYLAYLSGINADFDAYEKMLACPRLRQQLFDRPLSNLLRHTMKPLLLSSYAFN